MGCHEVQDLTSDKKQLVHAARMKFYSDSSLNVTERLIDQVAHDDTGYVVEELLDLRRNGDSFDVLVRWLGFSSSDDTWEDVFELSHQVPKMLIKFLKDRHKVSADMSKRVKAALRKGGMLCR